MLTALLLAIAAAVVLLAFFAWNATLHVRRLRAEFLEFRVQSGHPPERPVGWADLPDDAWDKDYRRIDEEVSPPSSARRSIS